MDLEKSIVEPSALAMIGFQLLQGLVKRTRLAPKPFPWFIAGAAAGALALYLLDPKKGRERREAIREKGMDLGKGAVEYGKKALYGIQETSEEKLKH